MLCITHTSSCYSLVVVIIARRQNSKNADIGHAGVRMSGLEERGVQNPLAMEGDDVNEIDKEILIHAMQKN